MVFVEIFQTDIYVVLDKFLTAHHEVWNAFYV